MNLDVNILDSHTSDIFAFCKVLSIDGLILLVTGCKLLCETV